MNMFCLNVVHYAKRAFRDIRDVLLVIGIPLGLIIVWGTIFTHEGVMWEGYNVAMSNFAPAFMLSFQFFSGGTMLLLLHKDLKAEMRWRLGMAPCPKNSFMVPAFFANWIFSVFVGTVLIVITAIFLNVYWGNWLILALVLALVSLIGILIFALVFLFVDSFSTANGLIYAISFGMMAVSGWLLIPLGNNRVADFLMNYTPLSLGVRAILYSGMLSDLEGAIFVYGGMGRGIERSWYNIGILAGIALVLGVVAVVASRITSQNKEA